MCSQAYAISILPEMYGIDKPGRIRSKVKIHFAELIRPDSYWPQPYSIEQAFQIYRWMIRTGKPFSSEGYGVYDLLIGHGTRGSGDLHYEPIQSLATLRERFHFAILGRPNGQSAVTWREKEGIAFGNSKIIHFPHYAPFVGSPVLGKVCSEAQIGKLLQAYFGARGTLRVQLNSVHADAIEIAELIVRVDPQGFRFVLGYGVDGSIWHHTLSDGENFVDAFGVAITEFERVSGQTLMAAIQRH